MKYQSEAAKSFKPRFSPRTSALDVVADIDLKGKLAVVTGGSGGIGYPTALALAKAGADVVVASRGGEKLESACKALQDSVSSKIIAVPLDLISLESVDAAAEQILALGRKVDILVNNAGIIGPLQHNELGIESGFAVNVVGHAVFTSHLSRAFSDGARLVFVSSFGHQTSGVVFDDINFENRPYEPWLSYGQSKSGAVLLAVTLSKRLKHRGIDAFSLHPGAIPTDMPRSMTEEDRGFLDRQGASLAADDYITPEQGAATSVWAATDPALAGLGGHYLQDLAIAELLDTPNYNYGVMPHALDPAHADRLWDETIPALIGRPLPLHA